MDSRNRISGVYSPRLTRYEGVRRSGLARAMPEASQRTHLQTKARLVLILACGYFASWGPAIVLPGIGIGGSKLFVLSGAGLIAVWGCSFILSKNRIYPFPRSYNLFLLFIFVHSCITFLLLYPAELVFSTDTARVIDETTTGIEQGRGMHVARYFFNVLFAYAMASSVRSKRELVWVILSLGAGFTTVMLISDRASIDHSEGLYRLACGFLNPNDLGATAMAVVLLCTFVLLNREATACLKLCAGLALTAGVYGVLASASRSALGASCVSILVVLYYSGFRRRLRVLAAVLVCFGCVAFYLPDETWGTLRERLSADTIRTTRGSKRVDIYSDYLMKFPQYALTGVGLMRATEITKGTYTTSELAIPHNAYLEILVEFGSLGLLLFLWSLGQFWRMLAAPLRREGSGVVMLAFLAMWLAYFLVASGGSRIFWLSWAVLGAYQYCSTCSNAARACSAPGDRRGGFRGDQALAYS